MLLSPDSASAPCEEKLTARIWVAVTGHPVHVPYRKCCCIKQTEAFEAVCDRTKIHGRTGASSDRSCNQQAEHESVQPLPSIVRLLSSSLCCTTWCIRCLSAHVCLACQTHRATRASQQQCRRQQRELKRCLDTAARRSDCRLHFISGRAHAAAAAEQTGRATVLRRA